MVGDQSWRLGTRFRNGSLGLSSQQLLHLNLSVVVAAGVLFGAFAGCTTSTHESDARESTPAVASPFEVDHFNLWVDDHEQAKARLVNAGFVAVPDSVTQPHHGQGTEGKYFNFLNGYLELIYVRDENELIENNAQRPGLDFVNRAQHATTGASPISVGLKMVDYAPGAIPFATIPYHQVWMGDGNRIYAAERSNLHLGEPSVFVVYPTLEFSGFGSLADLDTIPDEYAFWGAAFRHPNGAQRLTRASITSPTLEPANPTMTAVAGVPTLRFQQGSAHLLELHFDHQAQGKTLDLRPELPLLIRL